MIMEHFESLTDPRQTWKVLYPLTEIVLMTIVAVIAECDAWYQIHHYCKTKEKWFREKFKLELKHGIPSHDTFERVFAMLEPQEFNVSFQGWIRAAKKRIKRDIISIDGKTICGSKRADKRAIHMVSAWANKNRLVLGQIKTDEKSNEITAVPELLDTLDVGNCIVTVDAMSCQKDIAQKIAEKKADYVLALKENHPVLCADVRLYFSDFEAQKHVTKEKGHGRIETREYWLETDISWLWQSSEWSNLQGIGAVRSRVIERGETREETRIFLTSLTNVKKFAEAVRLHWGVENSLHWTLDVAFNEDNCRMQLDNSGENFAVVRHIALNLLKKDKSKMSVKAKRHRCAYDDEFLFRLIMQGV